MYSNETLKKLANLFKLHVSKIENGEIIARVHISKGNSKIGKVLNVSTVPVMDCKNCKECSKLCYAINSYVRYTNTCVPAWTDNSYLARNNRQFYFNSIRETLKRRKRNLYFRWHVAGEIQDMDYLENMVAIAKDFPNFKFWTYTKMYELVNLYCDMNGGKSAIPGNLVIMFSEWRGMPMFNKYGFPEFRVVFNSDDNKPDEKTNWFCPGNCDICKKACRGCIVGETTYCHEH